MADKSMRFSWLPESLTKYRTSDFSFITIHYLYFVVTCLISSVVFWGSSTPSRSVSYIDSVFVTVSAMSEAGLSTITLSQLNTWQQIILFLLIMLGSAIFVSSATIQVRKHIFQRKLQELADNRTRTLFLESSPSANQRSNTLTEQTIREKPPFGASPSSIQSTTGTFQSAVCQIPSLARSEPTTTSLTQPQKTRPDRNLFTNFSIYKCFGRKRLAPRLSETERRKLGGIEYDALCLLAWVVPLYFFLFQLIGAIGCGAWLHINRPDLSLQNAFNNSGMALLDANASALQTSYFMLLTLSLLILAGKTCFPPFLRLILWTMKLCLSRSESRRFQKWKEILEFTLDHPRRVYTDLFPSEATWWLVLSIFVLNGIDWLSFELLNLNNPIITSIPPRFRVLAGLFQAFAVRSGGIYIVTISELNPGTLVMYVLMMYLNAFPVAMTIRSTNAYEELSLGIFLDDLSRNGSSSNEDKDASTQPTHSRGINPIRNLSIDGASESQLNRRIKFSETRANWNRFSFLQQQMQGQLANDVWWLAVCVFLITIIETSSIHQDPDTFSVFNIIFEVISGYGTAGISTEVPWASYSFCGAWHTGSKLILCAVMLRGRHRGLPVAVDRAVLLPESSLAWADGKFDHLTRDRSGEPQTQADATGGYHDV